MVRLSPTRTQPVALIAFVYLIYEANPDKCHFLCSSNSDVSLVIENQKITISKFEKLLGIKLGSNGNSILIYMKFVKKQDRN